MEGRRRKRRDANSSVSVIISRDVLGIPGRLRSFDVGGDAILALRVRSTNPPNRVHRLSRNRRAGGHTKVRRRVEVGRKKRSAVVVVSSFVEVVVAGNGDTYLGRGLSWLSSVVGRRRRSDVVDVEGKRSFPGRACFPWRRMALTSPQCGALATVHMRLGRPSQPKALTPNSVAVRIYHRFHQHGTKGFFFYSSSPVKHRSYKPSRSSYSEKRSHDTKPPALELFSLSTRMKGFEAERCIKTYSCSHHSPPSHRLLPARCTTCRL